MFSAGGVDSVLVTKWPGMLTVVHRVISVLLRVLIKAGLEPWGGTADPTAKPAQDSIQLTKVGAGEIKRDGDEEFSKCEA